MDLLGIAARIAHPHPIDGIRALMQDSIKDDDSLLEAVQKKRFNTFLSQESHRKLQNIANVEFKLSNFNQTKEPAEEQLANLRSSGFKGLKAAELTLIEVFQAAGDTRGKCARAEIQRLVFGLQRQARQSSSYWASQLESAKRNGNRTDIALATAWLEGCMPETSPNELAVSVDEPQKQPTPPVASHMTISEAFKLAAETHGFTHSQLKELEDWVVASLALPVRRETTRAPYAPGDFPPLGQAAEGINLVFAQTELSYVGKALAADLDNPSTPQLRSLVADLHARVGATMRYWIDKHASLDGDADTALSPADEAELERIAQFLGMTGTNDDLDALSEAGSEDSYIASSNSDSEASRIHSALPTGEHSARAPASRLSSAFEQLMAQSHVSYAELTNLTKLFVQVSGIPDLHNDTRAPYQIHEFLAQRARQTPRTILSLREEMQHIQARLSGIDSGLVREFLQKQHFKFNDMIDRAENLWKQVADIRTDQGNASPYRALACQWLGLPEGTEPEVKVNAVADPDASLEVGMDHAPLAEANILNLFAGAMDCFRDAGNDFVEYELRSADAMVAMGSAFVGNLGFNLPGGQQKHVLADFPDALEMQTFRSIPDQMSDLDLMRSQLRHLDSVDGKRRLSDRLDSFRAALERAEDFWTDRLEDLEKRKAAGESVEDEIHIARKWLGAHDHVIVPDITPTSSIGGTHSHRRASSLASHLFVESKTEQLPQKHKMLADNTDSRAHASMMAMR